MLPKILRDHTFFFVYKTNVINTLAQYFTHSICSHSFHTNTSLYSLSNKKYFNKLNNT